MANKRIDQLPQSAGPQPHYYIAIRNMDTNITERLQLSHFMGSGTTANFEWDNEIEYLTDEVVTYGGFWWQALEDNDDVVPGSDPTIWVKVSKSPSGFVLWSAGIFTEDEVFILYRFEFPEAAPGADTATYLFRLKDATRPFNSTDFVTELEAGQWELVGKVVTVVVNTADVSDNVVIDCKFLQEMNFIGSNEIAVSKTLQFIGLVEGFKGSFVFSMSDPLAVTFVDSVKMVSPANASWENPAWTPIDFGEYEMYIEYINSQLRIRIDGPYI